ncbi:hypothetical protein [Aeromonas salmonicida]|uniref:hypothetical protein n=1 Tax=Aeromonas salmonicida TaxID=645 RepID=UPI000B4013F2|nr:hypothetical protein [Aeromonas salmonicida]ARW85311.1 hypothetical protein O23A_P3p0012 [Aeromonas salmonicida]
MGSDYIKSLKSSLYGNSFEAKFKEMEFRLTQLHSKRVETEINEFSISVSNISNELDVLRNEYFEACPGPLSILNDKSDGLILELIQVVEHRNFEQEAQQGVNHTPAMTATDELKAMEHNERHQFIDALPKDYRITSDCFNFVLDVIGDDHSLKHVLTEAQSQQVNFIHDEPDLDF